MNTRPTPSVVADELVERVATILKRFGYPALPPRALREIAALAASDRDVLVGRIGQLEDERARIEGALHKRMHIYRTKRDTADPLGADCYGRHEAFALVMEAFEIFEAESGIRAALVPLGGGV